MVKPKYPKRADTTQIARSVVEHATGVPLTSEKPRKKRRSMAAQAKRKQQTKSR